MKKLSAETQLLFFLGRINPNQTVLDKAASLINQIDWQTFISLTVKHGVTSIVYKNLLQLKDVPHEIVNKFENSYHNTLRLNMLMAAELDRIIKILSSNNIDVITLKGPVASEVLFGDIGLYPSGDIDFLVKVRDIEKTREVLESAGYHMDDKGFDEYREYYLKEHYHVSMSNGQFTIEPHWNLFMRYFTTPPDFWWEESMMIISGEKQYRFLSPEKNVLYNSFRLFYKGFTPLRFLLFVSAIIEHYKDEMNWNKLFDYARRYHFESVLRITLKLVNDMLGTQVPPRYKYLKNTRMMMLYPMISRMVLKAEDVPPFRKFILAFLRDDLKGISRIFLRRIFPPMGEIVYRYKLPPGSSKAVGYYLMNPMLILLRKHRG